MTSPLKTLNNKYQPERDIMNKTHTQLQDLIDKPCGESFPPFSRWLDGIIRSLSATEVTVEYFVREDMTNQMGTIHGGVVSAIFDDIMGGLANSLGKDELLVSLNLAVDFLGSAKKGEHLFGHARVIRNGKRVVNLEAELVNEEQQRLIARAHCNMITSNIKGSLLAEQSGD